jgi:hypothetical protein
MNIEHEVVNGLEEDFFDSDEFLEGMLIEDEVIELHRQIGDNSFSFFVFIHNESWSFWNFLSCFDPGPNRKTAAYFAYNRLLCPENCLPSNLHPRQVILALISKCPVSPSLYWQKVWRAKLEGMCGSCESEIPNKYRKKVEGSNELKTYATIYCTSCRVGKVRHL